MGALERCYASEMLLTQKINNLTRLCNSFIDKDSVVHCGCDCQPVPIVKNATESCKPPVCPGLFEQQHFWIFLTTLGAVFIFAMMFYLMVKCIFKCAKKAYRGMLIFVFV